MTREEAIIDLNALKFILDNDQYTDEIEEALDMAIDALKQPEIVLCKDCIRWREGDVYSYCDKLYRVGVSDIYCYMTSDDDFCSMAERR